MCELQSWTFLLWHHSSGSTSFDWTSVTVQVIACSVQSWQVVLGKCWDWKCRQMFFSCRSLMNISGMKTPPLFPPSPPLFFRISAEKTNLRRKNIQRVKLRNDPNLSAHR